MKQLPKPRCVMFVTAALFGLLMPMALRADAPATQPAAAPVQPVDTAEAKEVRQAILTLDADQGKMSLADFRKTFHTETDAEAQYADYLAHEGWEGAKTEQAVRDKWGPEADAKFCRLTGGTTREEDQVCDVKVDGNHAVLSWDIKDVKPQKMIKVDGQWLDDVHAMWDDWIKEDPTMETDRRELGKLMKQLRSDIADGKYDDADSFMTDLESKLKSPDGN